MDPAEERNLLLREVLSTLYETLKPLGFKKNGRRFERARGRDLIDFVAIQATRYPGESGFTYRVNTETLPLAIWKLHTRDYPDQNPAPGYHFWETALGNYTRPPHDRWQTVYSLAEAHTAAQDDLNLLLDFALPFLERVESSQGVIDSWKRGDYVPITEFFRDRIIADWEGRPEPRREDYPGPPAEELERNVLALTPFLSDIAKTKESFFLRRRHSR